MTIGILIVSSLFVLSLGMYILTRDIEGSAYEKDNKNK